MLVLAPAGPRVAEWHSCFLSPFGGSRLKRAQALAGLVFASYALVHVGNGAAAFVGRGLAPALLECVHAATRGWWGALFWIGWPVAVHALSAPLVFSEIDDAR
jgi:hypothetical protein